MSRTRELGQGTTLVELVVVIAVLAIILPMIGLYFVGAYRDSYMSSSTMTLVSKNIRALMYIEQSIRAGRGYLVSVPVAYTDAYGPHNLGTSGAQAWSYKGDSAQARTLLIDTYATSANTLNAARTPVYRADGPFNCTTQKYYQPQLHYVSVYFVRNSTLYRRVLADKSTILCAGDVQAQKQSCPPEIPVATRHVSCEAYDEVLADHVVTFSVEYYQDNSPSSLIDAYNSSDPAVLDPVDYALVTLELKDGAASSTMSQRIVLGNS